MGKYKRGMRQRVDDAMKRNQWCDTNAAFGCLEDMLTEVATDERLSKHVRHLVCKAEIVLSNFLALVQDLDLYLTGDLTELQLLEFCDDHLDELRHV